MKFSEAEDDSLKINNPELMTTIAGLLGSSPSTLEKALCYRVVGNKHGTIDKMHTVDQAVYGRNAFAKVGVVWCGVSNRLVIIDKLYTICTAKVGVVLLIPLWNWPIQNQNLTTIQC